MSEILKPLVEQIYADEIAALIKNDTDKKPLGWKMSPRAVRTFIIGGKAGNTEITRKFYGDDAMVERAVVTLASNRPLMLVGEPGTAKTMLSELLSAAICGVSDNTVQGSVGTTEENIKYSWNYSMLLSSGPSRDALIKAPVYRAMEQGIIVRFEEITRCSAEISDTLISVLSDKVMAVPELGETLFARAGFNVIGTANTRDKGVNEMSSALKRRFNFETVKPISDSALQQKVIRNEVERQLKNLGVTLAADDEYICALSTVFTDIRGGGTDEGYKVEKFESVMSTAEAVCAYLSCALDGYYFGSGEISPKTFNEQILSAVRKDSTTDVVKLKSYYENVLKNRAAKNGGVWEKIFKARKI
ncbi:MAG: AAA family ATPase [Clostridiales bacterium]|nr:AAA family ATPase [Clostridiales bacterium]MDE7395943.1 AAA family ATPase [Clostridiales bacterium]